MIQNTVRQLATRQQFPTGGRISSVVMRRCFSGDSDRIHSTDIAFKPAESGWGGGTKYSNNFDNIFGSTKKKETSSSSATTQSDSTAASNTQAKDSAN
mmetsp:Transcript_16878/g.23465  ORF Transcript_16878/g.23465 Transcript_16878/m.23465 type:complete len:98 (-) Transcript_16878:171-464(-)